MSIGALSSDPYFYHINQSALFRLGSKRRLAETLGCSIEELMALGDGSGRYRIFTSHTEKCPYTGREDGGRLIQDPTDKLKRVQRRVVHLLRRVEVPPYCHGGVKQSSYRTNAEVHKGSSQLITFDLRKYYPSTPASRVFDFFHQQLECPPDVSKILMELCCYEGMLPTGSPSSPLLSHFANRTLFDRLHEIARARQLIFSVYIDDLTFSGERIPVDLARLVAIEVRTSGHTLSQRKTRFFGANVAKHVTGAVIHGGVLTPPARRFQKARGLAAARSATTDVTERVKLSRQLAGLLGEAAQIAPNLLPWAKREYAALAVAESVAREAGIEVPSKKQRRCMKKSAVPIEPGLVALVLPTDELLPF